MPYGYTQPSNWAAIRKRIFIRDGGACYLCQAVATQVDAIIPESQGGSHRDEDNLAAICEPCHKVKSEAERRAGYAARRARVSRKRQPERHPGEV